MYIRNEKKLKITIILFLNLIFLISCENKNHCHLPLSTTRENFFKDSFLYQDSVENIEFEFNTIKGKSCIEIDSIAIYEMQMDFSQMIIYNGIYQEGYPIIVPLPKAYLDENLNLEYFIYSSKQDSGYCIYEKDVEHFPLKFKKSFVSFDLTTVNTNRISYKFI